MKIIKISKYKNDNIKTTFEFIRRVETEERSLNTEIEINLP